MSFEGNYHDACRRIVSLETERDEWIGRAKIWQERWNKAVSEADEPLTRAMWAHMDLMAAELRIDALQASHTSLMNDWKGCHDKVYELGQTNLVLKATLQKAREKLVLYRQAHGGEYVGGLEFTALLCSIDAALPQSETEGEQK